ncbi:adenylosuccinate synthase, partial [Sodalis-like symbiont of Bactericera trigonica]
DVAREKARGAKAIGTTGRGIAPAYEDKVARRALRVGDLFNKDTFATKLKEVVYYYNFQLVHYYQADAVDYQKVLDDILAVADVLTGMVVDVSELLDSARKRGDLMMFEGAQGTLLDIDHGTYPYVTSSNTTAGGVATGSGLGPRYVDHVLGIVKAYSTRVGAGPFPTELFDDMGAFLCAKGNEFGATTGRRRRTGWLDAVAVRRAVQINSLSGFCLTKLDVLDGLQEVKICTAYRLPDSRVVESTPLAAENWEGIAPIYETMPGWSESTFGVKAFDKLPEAARRYIKRIEEVTGVQVDIVSTGPDRSETIILRDPFEA